MPEEIQLLDKFRKIGDQAAFGRLVRQHIDMVYSVAVRQLGGDKHLAEDVCQETFATLARKAGSFRHDAILGGWLYRTAVYRSKDIARREARRRKREELVVREAKSSEDLSVDWDNARPILDTAIGELNEKDRAAVCLRFFEERSYPEIGERLGMSESAARMRVSRSLEKLSLTLGRKKIRSTAALLGSGLGAQISIAAPSALSAAIVQSTVVGGGASSIALVIHIMNTTKGVAGVASLVSAAAVGVAVYQTNVLRAETGKLEGLEAKLASFPDLDGELSSLRSQLASLDNELAGVRQESAATRVVQAEHGFAVEDFENELENWALRVDSVFEYLENNPSLRIPELDLLDSKDWLDQLKGVALKTEADYRRALSAVRSAAKHKTIEYIGAAYKAFSKEANGKKLTNLYELLAYSDGGLKVEYLDRFQLLETDGESDEDRKLIVEREPVDPVWYSEFYVTEGGAYGYQFNRGNADVVKVRGAVSHFESVVGREPYDSAELLEQEALDIEEERVDDILNALTNEPAFLSNQVGEKGE